MSLFHSPHLDSIEEDAPAPYFYERIEPQNRDPFYRLGDDDDNAIGHCDDEGSAKYVIELMNRDGTEPAPFRSRRTSVSCPLLFR